MPNQAFALGDCTIDDVSTLRPYAFKLTDLTSRTIVVYAADNLADYKRWMEVLRPGESVHESTEYTSTAPTVTLESEGDEAVSGITNLRPLEADVILDYFEKYNVSEVR
jgi:hypothetical protein